MKNLGVRKLGIILLVLLLTVVSFPIQEAVALEVTGEFTTDVKIMEIDGVTEFDPSIGTWENDTDKIVRITASFPENTTDKNITLSLPEGLSFKEIPIPSNQDLPSTYQYGIVYKVESTSTLEKAVTSVDLPTLANPKLNSSIYGDITYNLDNGVNVITIELVAEVDSTKYYGPHTIAGDIEVTANYGSNSVSNKLDDKVNATGNVKVDKSLFSPTHILGFYVGHSAMVATTSTDTDESLLRGRGYMMFTSVGTSIDNFYPEQQKLIIPIPKELDVKYVFNNFVELDNTLNYTITENDNYKYVVIDNISDSPEKRGYGITLIAPDASELGDADFKDYIISEPAKLSYVTYDGNTVEISTTETPYSYRVNKRDNTKYELSFLYNTPSVLAYGDHYQQLVHRRWINESGYLQENYIFEVMPDDNFLAKSIRMPGHYLDGSKIEIQYKELVDGNWVDSGWIEINDDNIRDSEYFTLFDVNRLFSTNANKDNIYLTGVRMALEPIVEDEHIGNYGDGSLVYGKIDTNVINEGETYTFKTDVNVYRYNPELDPATSGNTLLDKALVGEVTKLPNYTRISYDNKYVLAVDSYSYYKSYDSNNKATINFTAGDDITIKGNLHPCNYPYTQKFDLNDFDLYIKQHKGTTIDIDSLKIYNELNLIGDPIENIEYEAIPYPGKGSVVDGKLVGEGVYKIKTNDTILSTAQNYPQKISRYSYEFDLSTDISEIKSTLTISNFDFIGCGDDGISKTGILANKLTAFTGYFMEDGIDLNNNGTTTDILVGATSNAGYEFNIMPNNNVMVDSTVSVHEEDNVQPEYEPGDVSTVVSFTTDTELFINLDVFNNSKSGQFINTLYVPIPKTGENFGINFQEEAFKWDMKLKEQVNIDRFEVSYGTITDFSDYKNVNYYESFSSANIEDYNMLKIVINNLGIGESKRISIPLVVDETKDSAQTGNKLGTYNIFNPAGNISSENTNLDYKGSTIGTKLVIEDIQGLAFEDKNYNGIYDTGDTVLPNLEVELYEKDAQGNYNYLAKVVTDLEGKYIFNDQHGMNLSTYKVVFPTIDGYLATVSNVGDFKLDSDINTDLEVLDMSGVSEGSSYVNAGYIKYDGILGALVKDYEVLHNTTTDLDYDITPDFFEFIQEGDIEFTTDDSNIATIVNGVLKARVIEQAMEITTGTISIKDIYGNIASHKFNIFVFRPDATKETDTNGKIAALDVELEWKEVNKDTIESLIISESKVAGVTVVNNTYTESTTFTIVDNENLTNLKDVQRTGGEFKITICNGDSENNTSVTIKVTVNSDQLPTITNVKDLDLKAGETFVIPTEVKANDAEDGDITDKIVVGGDVIDTTTSGTYNCYYEITDSHNNVVKEEFTVNIYGMPEITGVKDVRLNVNDTFDALDGVSAKDAFDNELEVTVTGTVDMSKVGLYKVTYSATDKANNTVTETATIIVWDVPTISGAIDKTIYVNSEFNALDGVSGRDAFGNKLDVTVEGIVETSTKGVYIITYSTIDKYGYETTCERKITVIDKVIEQVTTPEKNPIVVPNTEPESDPNITPEIEQEKDPIDKPEVGQDDKDDTVITDNEDGTHTWGLVGIISMIISLIITAYVFISAKRKEEKVNKAKASTIVSTLLVMPIIYIMVNTIPGEMVFLGRCWYVFVAFVIVQISCLSIKNKETNSSQETN